MKNTPETRAAFCAALATAGGNVTRACAAIDLSRETVYAWRKEDPEFERAWDEAKVLGLDALEDEGIRRSFEGTDKPVFHQGVKCGTIREYDSALLMFFLKGNRPEKYRERSQVDLSNQDGSMQTPMDETARNMRIAAILERARLRMLSEPATNDGQVTQTVERGE